MTSQNALQILHSWFSPAYPVGAFSYSHGLEAAITAGDPSDATSLQAWLAAVLDSGAGRNDALLLIQAMRAETPAALEELADLAEALSPSAERQLETMAQGEAFAKVTSAVWSIDVGPWAYPVAVGQAARALHLPEEPTAALYLQGFAGNLVSAAIRFMPLGQTDGQRVLAALFPLMDHVAQAAMAGDLDDLGGIGFGADLASMAHEAMTTRIFRT